MSASKRIFLRRRAALVDHVRRKGVHDEAVLAAVGSVPREHFLDQALAHRAYEDVALPIGLRQTISQPYTVAYQTMLAELRPGERVLEIGTGSGYQAAVLSALKVRVFSVERHKMLHDRASALLKQLGYRVVTRHGDGTEGWQACAPFDAIIVTAGIPVVPDRLKRQLCLPEEGKRGGRLVIPVGGSAGQVMTRMVRTSEDVFTVEEFSSFRFVPLVKG